MQTIKFPSQNISSDVIPDPLETLLVDKIENSDIQLNVSLGLGTASLVINLNNVEISNLGLEYSINGVDWFLTSVFEIDESGTYTAYIRDKFGCSHTKQFNVAEIKGREDYFEIPKSNAIPFVLIQSIDEERTFNNDENLFQCDNLSPFAYSEDVLFQKKDRPSLQIKSNYKTLEVYLRKEDETQQEILMSKKSSNLSKFEKLDCIAYSHSSNRLAVYFESGNTYNESGIVNGTHDLQGNLPDFARIGNYVEIDNLGTFQISSILIDYDINKKIIIFEEEYIDEQIETSASSIYDILPFEVYEHYFNFKDLEEGYYDIYIKATSSSGFVKEYLSENIFIKENHEQTISIHYYGSENKDLFYKYGLINQLRVRYSDLERYIKDESEININDDLAQLIKSFVNFGYEFNFEDLTTKQLDILILCLSSESVFINGIGYIKDSSPSYEKIKNTNIYNLKARMLKTNFKLNLSNPRLSLLDFLIPIYIPTT